MLNEITDIQYTLNVYIWREGELGKLIQNESKLGLKQ